MESGSGRKPGLPGPSGPEKRSDLASGIRVTVVGAVVNLALAGLKLWIGTIANSRALVADGVHSLSDLFTDFVVLLGLKWGRKEPDQDHPYGHARIETVAGFIIGLVLIMAGVAIAYKALVTIHRHEITQPTYGAAVVAAVSILVKEIMFRYSLRVGRRIRSLALVGNAWHHRTDALSSVAVLAGVSAGLINPEWYLADAYASVLVALLVFKSGADLSWTSFKEVVDTAPDESVLKLLEREASAVEGVREAHDILARSSGSYLLVEVHIVVDPDLTVREGHTLAKSVKRHLLEKVSDVAKVIVHVDPDPKGQSDQTDP